MLTKEDIKMISDLLDDKLDKKFESEIHPMRDDIRRLDERVGRLEGRVAELNDQLKKIRKDLKWTNFKIDRNMQRLKEVDSFARDTEYFRSKKFTGLEDDIDIVIKLLEVN